MEHHIDHQGRCFDSNTSEYVTTSYSVETKQFFVQIVDIDVMSFFIYSVTGKTKILMKFTEDLNYERRWQDF